MTTPYNKIDHTHCWKQENPPCGIKGKHRCCLCEEPVPTPETQRVKPVEEVASELTSLMRVPYHEDYVQALTQDRQHILAVLKEGVEKLEDDVKDSGEYGAGMYQAYSYVEILLQETLGEGKEI